MAYISGDVHQLPLSNEACEQLGMNNATVSEVEIQYAEDSDMILPDENLDLTPCTPSPNTLCTCPRREHPPPPPQYPPGMLSDQRKQSIMKHYASSAFNKRT